MKKALAIRPLFVVTAEANAGLDNGHQRPIITSRRDLPAAQVAYRVFDRWRQENFFKYLREERKHLANLIKMLACQAESD